jgi:tRNA threonylcarbamoyladenosine biosynthesis protein TsaB
MSPPRPPRRLACVDTSTFTESIALVEGDALIGERNIRRDKGHASGLHLDLDDLLRDAGWRLSDLDGLVCGTGPGSFTGMRVGVAAFKGLAQALSLPIYGVPSTRALLSASGPGALALVDARRGEVYAEGEGLRAPLCGPPEALIAHFKREGLRAPAALIGEGALRHRARFEAFWPGVWIPPAAAHAPRAALLAHHTGDPHDLATLEPIYVRASDAELNYPDGFPSEARLFERPRAHGEG